MVGRSRCGMAIAEHREAMVKSMAQKEKDDVVRVGMAKIFGLEEPGAQDDDEEYEAWSRSSSHSSDDGVRPVRVQPKPRGFWKWDQGRPSVHTQFPPCLPIDPDERLKTPELAQENYEVERDTTTPDPFADLPAALPASPLRKDRPTVWRQWSLDRQQERPR